MRSTSLFIYALAGTATVRGAVAKTPQVVEGFSSGDTGFTSSDPAEKSAPFLTPATTSPTSIIPPEPDNRLVANTTTLAMMPNSAYEMWSPDGDYTLALHLNDRMELDIPIPSVVWANFCQNATPTCSTRKSSTVPCTESTQTITITERPSSLSATPGSTLSPLPTASSGHTSPSSRKSSLHSSTLAASSILLSIDTSSVNTTLPATSTEMEESSSAIASNTTTTGNTSKIIATTTKGEATSSSMSTRSGNRTSATIKSTSRMVTTHTPPTHVGSSTPASSESSKHSGKDDTPTTSPFGEFNSSTPWGPVLKARSPVSIYKPLPFIVAPEATCAQECASAKATRRAPEIFPDEAIHKRKPNPVYTGGSTGNWSATIPHVFTPTSSWPSSIKSANAGIPRRLRTVDWWPWNRARSVSSSRRVAEPVHLPKSETHVTADTKDAASKTEVYVLTSLTVTTYITTSAAQTRTKWLDDRGDAVTELPTDLYSFFSTIAGSETESATAADLPVSTRTEPHGAPATQSQSQPEPSSTPNPANPAADSTSTSTAAFVPPSSESIIPNSSSTPTSPPDEIATDITNPSLGIWAPKCGVIGSTTIYGNHNGIGPLTPISVSQGCWTAWTGTFQTSMSPSETPSLPPLEVVPAGNGAAKENGVIGHGFEWVTHAGWGLLGAIGINGMWQFRRMARGEVEVGRYVGQVWM